MMPSEERPPRGEHRPEENHIPERRPSEEFYPSGGPPRRQPLPERRRDERSFGDLLRELAYETRTLIRQEINLAQTEVSEKASQASNEVKEKASEAGKDLAYVGLGGAIAYAGLIALVFSLALLLGTLMPDWLAFLIAGAAVALIGYALVQAGLSKLRRIDYSLSTDLTLSKTAQSLQEDKQWMKEEVREIRAGETEMKPRRERPEIR